MQNTLDETETAPAWQLAGELHTLVGQLKRRLREQASMGDLPRSQASVLRRLDKEGPATVTALARAEGMRSQSMGVTIAALQEAGMVTGEPDPADGRQTILSLTPSCQQWIRDGRATRQDWLYRAIREQLTAGEQQQVMTAVHLLNRLVRS